MSSIVPGRSTLDGVVVATHAGASWSTLLVVALFLMVASGAVGAATGLILWAFGVWGIAFGLVALGAALLGAMFWSIRQPDGLRVGVSDVALMRGNLVIWRRPMIEIERVDWDEGEEWVSLVTVDGEVRGVSVGTLPQGAVNLLIHHLRTAVRTARTERDEPDAAIVALVRAGSRG